MDDMHTKGMISAVSHACSKTSGTNVHLTQAFVSSKSCSFSKCEHAIVKKMWFCLQQINMLLFWFQSTTKNSTVQWCWIPSFSRIRGHVTILVTGGTTWCILFLFLWRNRSAARSRSLSLCNSIVDCCRQFCWFGNTDFKQPCLSCYLCFGDKQRVHRHVKSIIGCVQDHTICWSQASDSWKDSVECVYYQWICTGAQDSTVPDTNFCEKKVTEFIF